MKFQLLKQGWLIASLLLFVACSSTGEVSERDQSGSESEVELIDPSKKLSDYLRSVGGVNVTEVGGQIKITVRGALSFEANTDPLFVIDGIRSGYNYSQVESQVPVQNIQSVRVLKGSDATAQYGISASNGAIVIVTKRR